MKRFQVEIIETVHHFITVTADDEHEALKRAELQIGEPGYSSAPEFSYKTPKLLGE